MIGLGTNDLGAVDADNHKELTAKYLENMTTLAGSVTNLYKELHIARDAGITLDTALKCVSTNPRKYMGLPTEIKVGDKADFVVLDKNCNLVSVQLGTTCVNLQ